MARRAVFLDRDGVLNEAVVKGGKPYPPQSVADLRIIPGTRDALDILKSRGFLLIVITNQPDVARGKTSKESVEEINDALKAELPLDQVRTCYHDDQDNCDCRKPKAGLILSVAEELCISLNESYMIGDRWKDVEAGIRAGCKTIFIDYGYDEPVPVNADFTASTLSSAYRYIVGSG